MAARWPPAVLSSQTRCPTLPPQQYAEYQVEFGGEIRLACGRRPGIGAYHKQATSRKRPQVPAGKVAEPPSDPVPHHRGTHGAAYREAHSGRIIPAGAHQQMAGQQRPARTAAAADRLGELSAPPHPGRRWKHRFAREECSRAGQTLTRARPLRRRAARTARPALVRMRSLNPCVLARRRLFGWNVRLLTGAPGTVQVYGRGRCRLRQGQARFSTAKTGAGVTGPMNATRAGR